MEPEGLGIARTFAKENHEEALDLLRTLARITAPSHHEGRRATFVRDWMASQGMEGAYVDQAQNVICPIADDGSCDLVVFAAHTDVVFPDEDELPLREEGGRLYAPGVGDDTANLVAVMLAGRHLARNPQLLPQGLGVLIVANSCEEGLGNLKGTRELFSSYGSRIRRFYSFDLYLPGVVSTAVGSHRWRISVKTQGGHSFMDFGRPNAVERLCALVQALYGMDLPEEIPTTVNVGSIEGGTSVNVIASQASCLFEYRSLLDEVLRDLRSQMEGVVGRFRTDGVEVTVEEVGIRPASSGSRSRELDLMTEASCDVIRSVTGEEPYAYAASTDANIPLSRGICANTIGAVRGALAHTRDEWIEASSLQDGLAVVLGTMLVQVDL